MAKPKSINRPQRLSHRYTVTVREAAEITGISRTGLYNAMRAGNLKAIKVGNRRLVKTEDLFAFIDGAADRSRIDALALPHARAMLLELYPDGESRGNTFVLPADDQNDRPHAVMRLDLSTGSWIDVRDNQDPKRGQGMVSLLAHLLGVAPGAAIAHLAQRLSLTTNTKDSTS